MFGLVAVLSLAAFWGIGALRGDPTDASSPAGEPGTSLPGETPGTGTTASAGLTADPASVAEALAAIDALPPPPSEAAPAYERAAFLPGGWADLDGDGCHTRDEILQRDLEAVTFLASDPGCAVAGGRLADPYTGAIIEFDRAESTQTVQIDHIVSLAEAWRAGAWAWTKDQRQAFANDPAELLAVAGAANQAKGDSGPAEWLPEVGRCGYGAAYAALAGRYQLAIPSADRRALTALLAECRG
jgi:hypothetical protein